MTNFGHKIMLTVLVLLITPPLGFAAATVNASPLTQTSKVTVKGVVKDAAGAPLARRYRHCQRYFGRNLDQYRR